MEKYFTQWCSAIRDRNGGLHRIVFTLRVPDDDNKVVKLAGAQAPSEYHVRLTHLVVQRAWQIFDSHHRDQFS